MAIVFNGAGSAFTNGAATSCGTTLSANINNTYVVVVYGISASSNISSITQTNVNWQFQAWVQNIASGGISVEVWVGVPTGTPGTGITVNNSTSCQFGFVVYAYTGLSSRTDVVEDVWIGHALGSQVIFPAYGTGGAAVALHSCLITAPSGTAISAFSTEANGNWAVWGSHGYGTGTANLIDTTATVHAGPTWTENSSYGQILVMVILKGYTGIGIRSQTINIATSVTNPPWSYSPTYVASQGQLAQLLLTSQYFSSSATDSGVPSCTGMTFTQLGAATPYLVSAGHYLHLELWIGYPTAIGTQPGNSITVTPTSGVAFNYQELVCIQLSGLDAVGTVLENGAVYTGTASSASLFSVTGVVTNTAGDFQIFAVSESQGAPTTITWALANHATVYSSGPCQMTCWQLAGSAGTNTFTDNISPQGAYWTGIAAVLKAPGANPHNVTFSDSFPVIEAFAKNPSRTLTDAGISAMIADAEVRNRKVGGTTHVYSDACPITDAVVKTPNKKFAVDAITITEDFAHTHIPGGPQILTDVIPFNDSLARRVSLHPEFDDALEFGEADFETGLAHALPVTDAIPPVDLMQRSMSRTLTDVVSLVETFATIWQQSVPFLDTIVFTDALGSSNRHTVDFVEFINFVDVFITNFVGPGGPPIFISGDLTGSSFATGYTAAWIYAFAQGSGRLSGLVGVAFLVRAVAKGLTLLQGLGGEVITDSGLLVGGSHASAFEGSGVQVVCASAEGDGAAGIDDPTQATLYVTSIGEAHGTSSEMDSDTCCIFLAEGVAMPDPPGSSEADAVGFTHVVAVCKGSSLALARVHSPVVVSGQCAGDSTAFYVSIAIYDTETLVGESQALVVVGGKFQVRGACSPIMASHAIGTANYGLGRLAGIVRGRGIVAGVPTTAM